MVDRQYDAMRRERLRLADDPNGAKNLPKPQDDELPSAAAPTANGATEAPVNDQEVNSIQKIHTNCIIVYNNRVLLTIFC